MIWWQILLSILGSGFVTALITGGFNFLSNKQNNKYNQERFELESKNKQELVKYDEEQKKLIEQKQNDIEKAKDLYRIIKQGINCEYISFFVKYPEKYVKDFFVYMLEQKDNHKLTEIYDFIKKQKEYKFIHNDDNMYEYFINLIEKDIKSDIFDFEQRYFIYSENYNRTIKINVEKLNKDIDFVNKTLNLNIEKIIKNENKQLF